MIIVIIFPHLKLHITQLQYDRFKFFESSTNNKVHVVLSIGFMFFMWCELYNHLGANKIRYTCVTVMKQTQMGQLFIPFWIVRKSIASRIFNLGMYICLLLFWLNCLIICLFWWYINTFVRIGNQIAMAE